MRKKVRTFLVVGVSFLVIAAALGLTVFGFYAYLEWKKQNLENDYARSFRSLNAQLFQDMIKIKVWGKVERKGGARGRPMIEGTITNGSNKTIYSLKLKVSFKDPENRVVYITSFYPVDPEEFSMRSLTDPTKNFLSEGNTISFAHQLNNCPPQVYNYLRSKLKFAKARGVPPLTIEYKIDSVDLR